MVAECGNISLAAEKLYISQPAVSKSVKKLEETSGVVLFSRNSRGVQLTSEGKLFYEHIKKAMAEIARGEDLLKKLLQYDKGKISVGVSTTLFKHFLVPKLKSFISKYPHLEINVVNRTTFESLTLMDEGKIDLCMISKPLELAHYNFLEQAEIQDIFVASKGYLASLGNGETLNRGKFIFMEKGNITREYVERSLAANHIAVNPEIVFGNMDFLIEFAKIGMGIAAVIKDFVIQELAEGSLVELTNLPTIPKRSVGIAYHKHLPLSLAASVFLEHIIHDGRSWGRLDLRTDDRDRSGSD
jgi:DNA-binding transcriptional LysR family regulator